MNIDEKRRSTNILKHYIIQYIDTNPTVSLRDSYANPTLF